MPDCTPCLEKELNAVPATCVVDGVHLCDRHKKIHDLRARKNAMFAKPIVDATVIQRTSQAMFADTRHNLDNARTIALRETVEAEKRPENTATKENWKKTITPEVDWSAVQRDRDAGARCAELILKYGQTWKNIKEHLKENAMIDKDKWAEAQKMRNEGTLVAAIAKKLGCSQASVYNNTKGTPNAPRKVR